MNNIDKNSDNKKLINSEQDTLKQKITNTKDIILDTHVNITVELGKSQIKIKDFLNFSKGSMLILDKLIKEPLDILINGDVIASGEIVFLEKEYGLRITGIKKSLKTIHMSV